MSGDDPRGRVLSKGRHPHDDLLSGHALPFYDQPYRDAKMIGYGRIHVLSFRARDS